MLYVLSVLFSCAAMLYALYRENDKNVIYRGQLIVVVFVALIPLFNLAAGAVAAIVAIVSLLEDRSEVAIRITFKKDEK